MTRLFTSGAEYDNAASDGVTLTGAGYTAAALSGGWSWLATETISTTQRVRATFTAAAVTHYVQVRLRFDSNAVNWGIVAGADIFTLADTAGSGDVAAQVRIDNAGKPMLFAKNVQVGSTGATALLANTQYVFELGSLIGTGAVDYAELRIDGVSIASGTSLNITDFQPQTIQVGSLQSFPAATVNITIDDLVLNDNAGGADNTWPGGVRVGVWPPIPELSAMNQQAVKRRAFF